MPTKYCGKTCQTCNKLKLIPLKTKNWFSLELSESSFQKKGKEMVNPGSFHTTCCTTMQLIVWCLIAPFSSLKLNDSPIACPTLASSLLGVLDRFLEHTVAYFIWSTRTFLQKIDHFCL